VPEKRGKSHLSKLAISISKPEGIGSSVIAMVRLGSLSKIPVSMYVLAGIMTAVTILTSSSPILEQPAKPAVSALPLKQNKIAVINPTFTAAAYQRGGFYSYFRGICSEKCLTVHLISEQRLDSAPYYFGLHDWEHSTALTNYVSSARGIEELKKLGQKHGIFMDIITDEQLTEDPSILKGYDQVVVLHNEYVSQSEFSAITGHKHVLYLYPNPLYALVSYNPDARTITLLKGHGYGRVGDAFGWGPSISTKSEYDLNCSDLHFIKVKNGDIINCYPEDIINFDRKLQNEIESRLFAS
jgi:hypothetical protein